MKFKRSSGILMHITSLPSRFGIGDIGQPAYEFIDFLAASGQTYWQILPLNPTQMVTGNSPYSSPSAFAGNTLLISPELLVVEGYLQDTDLQNPPAFTGDKVDFSAVITYKMSLLDLAYQNFKKRLTQPDDFQDFCLNNSYWLNDYALWYALDTHFDRDWPLWPEPLRDRDPDTLAKAEYEMADPVLKEKFLQYLFYTQWQRLVQYANKKGIRFIGDLPFYIGHDSADCWAHPVFFKLDEKKHPKMVSGVPPDMFSDTGQLWGTPVYDWPALQANNFEWWVERLEQNLKLLDVVRIDHFRAFSAYWEVPADHENAIKGKWTPSPGEEFFRLIQTEFPQMPFIAEDLGEIDQPVYDLRDKFHLPGMNLLQYAFDKEDGTNPFLPHNYIRNSVVYTGTHDNNTTKGWFRNSDQNTQKRFAMYAGKTLDANSAPEALCRLALMSIADLAVIPMQDILELGEEAIMNRPGTANGNWLWRLQPGSLTEKVTERLKKWTELYGRGRKAVLPFGKSKA